MIYILLSHLYKVTVQSMKQVFTTLTILLFLCNCTGSKKDSSIDSNQKKCWSIR